MVEVLYYRGEIEFRVFPSIYSETVYSRYLYRLLIPGSGIGIDIEEDVHEQGERDWVRKIKEGRKEVVKLGSSLFGRRNDRSAIIPVSLNSVTKGAGGVSSKKEEGGEKYRRREGTERRLAGKKERNRDWSTIAEKKGCNNSVPVKAPS